MELSSIPQTSLGYVRARDREGWLKLFSDDAVVEDPVGPYRWDPDGRGQRGKVEIGAFYDMFCGFQNAFDFEIVHQAVCGNEVAALVDMHITMKDGSRHTNRSINIYRVGSDGRVQSLRAFWHD